MLRQHKAQFLFMGNWAELTLIYFLHKCRNTMDNKPKGGNHKRKGVYEVY